MDNITNKSDFLFYSSENNNIKINVILEDETVWLTRKGMSDIFNTTVENIRQHIQNIFESLELIEDSVSKKILYTAADGKKYNTQFYNLDIIIAVGYRVNSYEATQFRIWATNVLKEYLIKGFALDDERLKQGKVFFDIDYFDELIERIREIRASERRFYQKITDIYAQCSADYDSKSPITTKFYATVQNKLYWAITGKTAAEIIKTRVNSGNHKMSLTSWKNESKGGKILKVDVSVAKNYLKEDEIKELNALVVMYLDYAELQAKRGIVSKMSDWVDKLNSFLKFNEYNILTHAGRVRKEIAKRYAESEYEKYRVIQDKEFESDFDKAIEDIKAINIKEEKEKMSFFDESLKKALDYKKKKD